MTVTAKHAGCCTKKPASPRSIHAGLHVAVHAPMSEQSSLATGMSVTVVRVFTGMRHQETYMAAMTAPFQAVQKFCISFVDSQLVMRIAINLSFHVRSQTWIADGTKGPAHTTSRLCLHLRGRESPSWKDTNPASRRVQKRRRITNQWLCTGSCACAGCHSGDTTGSEQEQGFGVMMSSGQDSRHKCW